VLEIVALLLALPTADKKEKKKQKMLVESRGLKCATLWQAAFCLLLFCFVFTIRILRPNWSCINIVN